jgi:hypothetical protein
MTQMKYKIFDFLAFDPFPFLFPFWLNIELLNGGKLS